MNSCWLQCIWQLQRAQHEYRHNIMQTGHEPDSAAHDTLMLHGDRQAHIQQLAWVAYSCQVSMRLDTR